MVSRGKSPGAFRVTARQPIRLPSRKVATVIWVMHATRPETHVFVEIDGRPVEGSAWAEIDEAVL
jgi:hypothetical protein